MKITATLLTLFTLFLRQLLPAQESTYLSLPEGAVARLGKGTINAVQYSPDGTYLAVATSIGIWLYDTTTYQVEHSQNGEVDLFTGHTGSVLSIAFSPNGKLLASGGRDNTVRLWNMETDEITKLYGHRGWIYSVAFRPDGRTLAVGSWDKTVVLWKEVTRDNTVQWEHNQTLYGHTGPVYSVAFSPDGSVLASGSEDKTVRLWETVTWHQKRMLTGYTSGVYNVAFRPDGGVLATGSPVNTAWVWDTETWEQLGWTFAAGMNWIDSIVFSPDGTTIASTSVGKR